MRSFSKVAVLFTLIACSYATPIFEPIFVSLSEDPQPETKIIKRDVTQENTDGTLKQVSLQSLIGGLEHSLVRSALSVSSIMQSKGAGLTEVIPPAAEENHANKKRHTEQTESTEAYHQITSTEIPTGTKGLLLQTTEQVPSKEGLPAHILIDRVTVQDFSGDFPLILPFEVKHTKLISATISSGNSTEISITKTSTTSTSTLVGTSSSTENPATASSTTGSSTQHPTVATTASTRSTEAKANGESPSSLQANTETTVSELSKTTGSADINSSSSKTTTPQTTTTSTTSSTTTTTTTTKTPTIKLKEAEQELKEKVAEIEADPVILSSRI